MPTEFEHRLLVDGDQWRSAVEASHRLRQTYLSSDPDLVVRVRVVDEEQAYLTIKGHRQGIGRPEFEYGVPVADAADLFALARGGHEIDKTRHELGQPWPGWVVDEFDGANAGLTIAELEVEGEDTAWERPVWAGTDVTDDDRYANAALFVRPFTTW